MKLPAHSAGPPGKEISFYIVPLDPAYKAVLAGHLPVKIRISNECEAPRAQRGASRKGNFFYIVPLDPAYEAGLAGHLPANKSPFPPFLKGGLRGIIHFHYSRMNTRLSENVEKNLRRYDLSCDPGCLIYWGLPSLSGVGESTTPEDLWPPHLL